MKKIFRENGLSIVMFGLFLLFWVGQSVAGFYEYNQDQAEHGAATLTYVKYLSSSGFWEATTENWESEFLQIGMYIILTAFLFQKGSAESKSLSEPNDVDKDPRREKIDSRTPWPVRRRGWVLSLYNQSLSLAFLTLFLISFFLHASSGARAYNQEQAEHGLLSNLSMWQYLGSSKFWFESLQNWQSEFMSVGALVVLSIFLRQKGSPESKPVATPHRKEEAA